MWLLQELEIQIRDKQHNLRRMEAQRNELNNKGKAIALWKPLGLCSVLNCSSHQIP